MLTIRDRTLAIVMVIPLLLVTMFFIGVHTASALTVNCFSDVTTGMWFHDYVCWMFDAGLTAGYPDGTYRPFNNITRAEIAVMMQQISGEGSIGPVVDADKLDGSEAVEFASITHTHSAGQITSGTLNEGRYSAYSDLSSESRIGPMIYSGHQYCYTQFTLTISPVCSTRACGSGFPPMNYDCSGVCNQFTAETCANTEIGNLIDP